MKRKPYTVQEKEILLQSMAIENIANSSATYTKEFKLYAVGEYLSGKTPLEIFIEAGVDIDILGREQPQRCLSRWLKIHRTYGPNGLLQENRGVNSTGRPSKKELSIEEKYEKTLKENEILKMQVEYLKKLRGWT